MAKRIKFVEFSYVTPSESHITYRVNPAQVTHVSLVGDMVVIHFVGNSRVELPRYNRDNSKRIQVNDIASVCSALELASGDEDLNA